MSKQLREVGDEYLRFWGECRRQRVDGSGVYAEFSRVKQFTAQQWGEAITHKKRMSPSEPPSGLVRYCQVEIGIRSFGPAAVGLRRLAVHVYELRLSLARYEDQRLVEMLRHYGAIDEDSRRVERWLRSRIDDLATRIGEQVMA